MDSEILTTFYEILKTVSRDNCARYMRNHFERQYAELMEATSFLDKFDIPDDKNHRISIFERIYCLEHGLKDRPRCECCGKEYVCGFDKQRNAYRKWCSPKCQSSDDACREKSRMTKLEKYGCSNYNGKEKSRKTRMEKYGSWHKEDFSSKSKNTKLEKYGSCTYVNMEKAKGTKLKRYGSESFNNPSKNKETRKRNFYNDVLRKDSNIIPMFSEEDYIRGDGGTKYTWKCLKCGNVFTSKFNYNFKCMGNDSYHVRCFNCFPHREIRMSESEGELSEFIRKNTEHAVLTSVRDVISPYELDVFIPDMKLAFEFDGLYWHSEKQGKDKGYHLRKTSLCEKLGIRLIHVFEDEWTLKGDIVRGRILNLLGKYDRSIFARKCTVKEIDGKTSREFIELNHIQGKCNSSYALGLFYGEELVSTMTFGKSRFSRKYEWELLRFCSKSGCHVIGGAGKLLKHFERIKNPSSMVSYADRRWGNGNVYAMNGFELLGTSSPNYWYLDDTYSRRLSRMLFQKHKLKDILNCFSESMSECENMSANGYDRIFDCGNMVFVKEY